MLQAPHLTLHQRHRRRAGVVVACLIVLIGGLSPGRTYAAEPLSPGRAVALARKNSPDLRAAWFVIAASRASVLAQDRARNPVVSGNAGAQHTERLGASKDALNRSGDDAITADAAVVLQTDSGTSIEFGADAATRWTRSNPDPSTLDDLVDGPSYGLSAYATVRHPLMRGAGEEAVLAQLRRARADLTAAERARDESASALIRDVLIAFWELWYAEASLEVELQALELSDRQVKEVKQRATRLGSIPEIDVLRLESEYSARQRRVVEARGAVAVRQIALARLMGLPPEQSTALHTVSQPALTLPDAPLPTLMTRALSQSPALAQAAARIQSAKEALIAAESQTGTRLDLTATLQAQTLWNEDGRFPGNRPGLTALVGLSWDLPFGPSAEEAQRDAAEANVEAEKARLEADVERLGEQLARQLSQLETATAAGKTSAESAILATRLAEMEAQRLALGTVIPTDLVIAQQSAREAQLARLRADTDRANAALAIEHLTGDLLARMVSETSESNP